MASDIHQNNCLVCTQVILHNNYVYLDKVETLFLLRVVLEIPQNSPLFYQSQPPLNLFLLCNTCGATVKQCKEIYTQIKTQIQKFRGFQSELLRKIQKETEHHPGHTSNQYWAELCRHFVKNRNVEAFKYPFVFHDLTELLNSFPVTPPITDYDIGTPIETTYFQIGCNLQEGRQEIPLDPFKDPLEIRNEQDDDVDKRNDISDQYESSEEEENPPQQFYWNPGTRQFHCSISSCTISSKIKMFVEKHFRREHSRAFTKPKITYTCNWPSCGKVFKKKVNHKSHSNKHNGTPSFKCEKCGKLFYYRRGLHSHQSRNICKPVHEPATFSNNIRQYSRSAQNIPNFVQNVIPNHDINLLEHSIAQTLRQPPPLPFPLCNIEDPFTITNHVSFTATENYSEESSSKQTKYFEEMSPSSSCLTSSAIEVTDTFIAENDKLDIKTESDFEDQVDNGDSNSNESNESYELSEDNASLDNDDDEEEEATGSNSKEAANYTCSWPGCGKRLCNRTSLSCHMDRHRGTPKHQCEECDHLFYSMPSLLNHRKKQHAKSLRNSDGSSNQIPSSSSKKKNSSESYKMKVQSADESEDDNERFENMQNKKSAQKRNYKKSDFSKNYPQYKFVRNSTTGKFHCLEPSCSKKAVTESYIENHFQVVHLKTKEKQSYACSWQDCGRSFSCKINLEGHLDQHKGTPQWKCEHCPRQCYWRSDLAKHVKRKHGIKMSRDRGTSAFNIFTQKHKVSLDETTGKYKCPEMSCHKSYKSGQTVINHYEEVHDFRETKTKKKMFTCEYDECSGRQFSTKDHWQGHMDKHKGTPQNKCEQCGKLFYWKGQLSHHVKAQH